MKKTFVIAGIGFCGALMSADELFREDWAESPAALPITQEHVANEALTLNLYGAARRGIKKSHHEDIPNDPYYVWTGEIEEESWALTLSYDDGRVVDLSGDATLRWRTRQSGEHCLRAVLKMISGNWLVSEPLVCESAQWQVTEHVFSELSWYRIPGNELLKVPEEAEPTPQLERIVEIGFSDFKAGNGTPASSRVDWLEVQGRGAPEIQAFQSISGMDSGCEQGPGFSQDGNLGTRWFAEGNGVQLTGQWDTPVLVQSLEIAWWKSHERAAVFEVQSSMDGQKWETVIPPTTSNTSVLEYEYHELEKPVESKWIRIQGDGNDINEWNAITEWQIRGKAMREHWAGRYEVHEDWCEIPGMGWVYMKNSPWIWHDQLTWISVRPVGMEAFNIWDFELGWFWTTETRYPLMYAYEPGVWYWFGGGPNPRWFYNMTTRKWEQG